MNLPPYLLQSPPETDACEAFSLSNLIFMNTGWLPSMVDLARVSDLADPDNERSSVVLAAANNIGLTAYSNCPLPNPLTVPVFYGNPIKVLRQKLNITLKIPTAEDKYLWVQLQWGSNLAQPDNHMAVLINDGSGDFIDSEPGGQIKNINKPSIFGASPAKIMWQSAITINNPPLMNQSALGLGKDGITVYILTPIAMDWENAQKQFSVEGIAVPEVIPPLSSF